MPSEKDYVLGTHDEEIDRLGLQHRVWRSRAEDAWRRARFGPGQTLIDLGCGPGWATLDLAALVGSAGHVLAIDRSRRFLDALERTVRARDLPQVQAIELDLDEQSLPAAAADGLWARWVFSFVKSPRPLLESAVRALRPGGAIVLHEYVDYRAFRLSPRSEAFEEFVSEVMASWREAGGEPDIALDLPRWLEELGMDVESLLPLPRLARPSEETWQWPKSFVEIGIRRLVDLGRLDAARGAAMQRAFDEADANPRAFITTPTVLEIVARRK